MKTTCFFTVLIAGLFLSACKIKTSKKIVVSDVFTETVVPDSTFIEPPPPPQLHFSSFLTLQECFVKMSQHEHPKLNDTAYVLGLYKISNNYVIFFIKTSDYKKNAEDWMTKKGSDYLDNYYPITKNEFTALSWEQAIDKIRTTLMEFSKTETFKKSALAKAKSITVRFDDSRYLQIK